MDAIQKKFTPKEIGILIGLLVLMTIYFSTAFWFRQVYGIYRSNPESIKTLLTIRRQTLSTIDALHPITESVCNSLYRSQGVYSQIPETQTALVNWRPLTVRLTGYLGGISGPNDGVFDMAKGVQLALSQGARAFVFDIDYLEQTPCNPVVICRDNLGYMRSLHTGSIKEGCKAIAERAFLTNFDPVLVILYLRRVPEGQIQSNTFFKSVAASLDPLSTYHLGSNDLGNFHNCRSEQVLFTSPIMSFQKKIIVLTNYNTTGLPQTQNPKDNLDFWTNARIWEDESGKSSALGEVTVSVPPGQIAYAQVGSTSQLLNIGTADRKNYRERSSHIFKIALSSPTNVLTQPNLEMLLNVLGIQCVPIDVVSLAAAKEHETTLKEKEKTSGAATLGDLSIAKNAGDVLSYWTYGGWSRKMIIGTIQTSSSTSLVPIPGFILPTPTVPKRAHPSTNSNGGLVSIA